jgi:hypothetical protein
MRGVLPAAALSGGVWPPAPVEETAFGWSNGGLPMPPGRNVRDSGVALNVPPVPGAHPHAAVPEACCGVAPDPPRSGEILVWDAEQHYRSARCRTCSSLAIGNKCVRVLLAGEGFDMALAGLAGVVAKPSLALFAGRCFPCALYLLNYLEQLKSELNIISGFQKHQPRY